MSTGARKRWLDAAAISVGVVVSLLLGWVLYSIQVQHERVDVLAQALADEQAAAEDRGETPVAPPPDELIEDPDAEYPPPPGPTDEQVLAAVQDYFREHPVEDGKDASPAAIAVAVINYLTEHPPEPGEPGPAPTAEQISAAVADYLAANPPPSGPPGADGEDGKDAEPLTSAEIQAELDAYLAAHPIEMCDPGWEAAVITVLTTGPPTDITTCVRTPEEN